jgi:anaerobic ribonucleoside-triphosphate reductase activating protein
MKIAWIKSSTLYEGGLAQEIYISGCEHNCEGCQNPELQDYDFGQDMNVEEIISRINTKFIDKVVLTGGDPLWSPIGTLVLLTALKLEYPYLEIWLYTGFTKEEIDNDRIMRDCFKLCDVVITDRYMKELPKTTLTGSNNQRICRKELLNRKEKP